ncbi:MAG: CoA-binding protein [Gammaproteobacteria bacterium]|nr:CoA-binding protein [Gammaproteobacteria bacterium]
MSNKAIRQILDNSQTIAIVGLSAKWQRPSYFAAKYLLDRGYKVIPVNPNYEEILGQTCYPDLSAIKERVDIVDLFQKAEAVPQHIASSAAIDAKVFWMQLGIINEAAAVDAREQGMTVVMDRCIKIEYARLMGGLTWSGVNTGVISAKRPRRVV